MKPIPAPPSTLKQLGLLVRTRVKMARNAASRAGAKATVGAFAALLAGLALAFGAGWLSAGPMEAAALAPPEPGVAVQPGGPYTEVGFWLGALGVFAFSFRIMEAIFRRQDVRALSLWPVSLGAQFAYRFLSAAIEVLLGACAAFVFMTAVWLKTGDSRAFIGAAIAAAGMVCSLTFGFAIQLGAGRIALGDDPSNPLQRVGRVDVGGFAAAFYYAPGVALISSLAALLLLDLAIVNEALTRGPSRLFLSGVGLLAGSSIVAVVVAWRMFVQHYPWLLARFYESDLIQLSTGYDYQRSARSRRAGLFELGLPPSARPVFRRDALQYGRRYPMLRILAVAVWIGLGLAAYTQLAPPAALAAAPAVLLFAIIAPWARLTSPDLDPGVSETLPLQAADRTAARLRVALREVVWMTGPAFVILGALSPWPEGATAAALGLLGTWAAAAALAVLSTPPRRAAVWVAGGLLSVVVAVLTMTGAGAA